MQTEAVQDLKIGSEDPDIIYLIKGLRDAEKKLQEMGGRISDDMIHEEIRQIFGERVEVRTCSQYPEGKFQVELYDRDTGKETNQDIFVSK